MTDINMFAALAAACMGHVYKYDPTISYFTQGEWNDLPLDFRRRWWRETEYCQPPSDELLAEARNLLQLGPAKKPETRDGIDEQQLDAMLTRQLQRSIDRNGRLITALRNVIDHLEKTGHPAEVAQLRAELQQGESRTR